MKKILGIVLIGLAALLAAEHFGILADPLGITDKIASGSFGAMIIEAWQGSGFWVGAATVIFCICLLTEGCSFLFGTGELAEGACVFTMPALLATVLSTWLPALQQTGVKLFGTVQNIFGSEVGPDRPNDSSHLTMYEWGPVIYLFIALIAAAWIESALYDKYDSYRRSAFEGLILSVLALPLLLPVDWIITAVASYAWILFCCCLPIGIGVFFLLLFIV